MADDLVARLRLISAWKTPGGPMPTEDMVNPHITCAEAADRIEQLEAALRIVMELSRKRSTHPMSPEADYFCIAGAALEGQDGEKV